MTRLRKLIATRMVESLRVSAQVTTVVEVDLTKVARIEAVEGRRLAREGVETGFLPFLALAATEALKAHPMVSASIEGDEVVHHGTEDLSIAVDTDKGLIVPVVKNAGDLNGCGSGARHRRRRGSDAEQQDHADDLAEWHVLHPANTGNEARSSTPIINQPQVAILGTVAHRQAGPWS